MAKKNGNTIVTNMADGKVTFAVEGFTTLSVNLAGLNAAIVERALFMGIKNRVIDTAAIPCDEVTGLPASPAEKYAAMQEMVEHLNSGTAEWNMGRTGGEREAGGITLRAVAAVQGVDVETMRKRVEELAEKKGLTTKAVYASLAKSPDVIRKVAELRAAKAGVDSDDILLELM